MPNYEDVSGDDSALAPYRVRNANSPSIEWRNAHPKAIQELVSSNVLYWKESDVWAAGRADACYGWSHDGRDYSMMHPASILDKKLRDFQGTGIVSSVADLVSALNVDLSLFDTYMPTSLANDGSAPVRL